MNTQKKYTPEQRKKIVEILTKNPEIGMEEFNKKMGTKLDKKPFDQMKWYYVNNHINKASRPAAEALSKKKYVRKPPIYLKIGELSTNGMTAETKTVVKQVIAMFNEVQSSKRDRFNAVELLDPSVIEIREVTV